MASSPVDSGADESSGRDFPRGQTDRVRVLVVHNRYVQPGGEDVQCEQEVRLLRDRGHDVRVIERTNVEIEVPNLGPKALLFARAVWSRPSYEATRRAIRDFRPQILHVHNFLPIVSPSVHHAAWAEDVPVVQTLHNYRLICPGATLYRDGRVCEDCVGRSTWGGARHACYRESHPASFAVASMVQAHRTLGTWRRIEAYIAVSDFLRRKVIAGGLPARRVHVKPNFVAGGNPVRVGPGDYALYVGRLAPEKGLRTLARAWSGADGRRPVTLPLKIVGSGPLEEELRQLCAASGALVQFAGQRPRGEVASLLAHARFLVYPSEWYEPLPVAVIEALAAGVPVLASRIGGLVELVEDGKTGVHFAPGDPADLARAASWITENSARNVQMGEAGRRAYLARYTPDQNYRQLLRIYEAAREARRQGSGEALPE